MLVIIQQRLGVWHSLGGSRLQQDALFCHRETVAFCTPLRPGRGTHEQPRQALELSAAVRRGTSLVVEQQTQVGAHWGNASA